MKEPIKENKTLLEEYLETSNKLVEQKIFTHRVINDTINMLLKLKLTMTYKSPRDRFIEDRIEEIYNALRRHRRNI